MYPSPHPLSQVMVKSLQEEWGWEMERVETQERLE
jgi:hypothetical protein